LSSDQLLELSSKFFQFGKKDPPSRSILEEQETCTPNPD